MRRLLWASLAICAGWLLLGASGTGALAPAAAAAPPGGQPAPARAARPAAVAAPADTPFTLVASGVMSYTINDPKIFYYSLDPCTIPPPPAPSVNHFERIERIPVYGGQTRTLYSHQVDTNCPSNPDVWSNVVSDNNYVYWMSGAQGVVKLSVDANVGDAPTVIATLPKATAEFRLVAGTLYILTECAGCNSGLWSMNPTNGHVNSLTFVGIGSHDFQADSTYLYWLNGGVLHQWDIATAKEKSTIASGVTGYRTSSATVYYGKGKTIHRFNNSTRADSLIYTSSNSTAVVYTLAFDGAALFWFEDHTLPLCGGCIIPSHDDLLFRAGLNGGSPTQIYLFHANLNPMADEDLRGDGDFLFWVENGVLQRMAKDAAALPQVNLVVDGMEVTQGVQYKTNGVSLIQGRDTYVRLYVHSAGTAVPGVTAYLYRTNISGTHIDGPLEPVNPAGELLSVLPSPHRNNLNDSFLFELPWNWVNGSTLYLRAELNPNQDPLEPNFADNDSGTYAFLMLPSPRLQMDLIEWGYKLNGQVWWPTAADEQLMLSWVRRAYPLASAPGSSTDPSPGFRPNILYIYDSGLGSRVNQTNSDCSDNLCASAYTNNLMDDMRGPQNIDDNIFMYGMITDRAGIFPRGQACCGTNVSSGPTGTPSGGTAWDTDASYGDWYAGHEIGHTLGRQHPSSSGDPVCDHQSADDGSYPYPDAHIGPNNGSLEGFDVGNGLYGINLTIYPGTKWTDVMSYCANEWISDYTYNGMYSYMVSHPYPLASAPAAPALSGDWFTVSGNVISGTNTAKLSQVARISSIGALPARVPGPDSIELYNGNSLLASYPFTPLPTTDDAPTWLHFSQVVTYVANTTQVRIVRLADSQVLASRAVSAHAPSVSNVALAGAPNPVAGTVTLNWTASDADGDPLTFDIFYSADGGATLLPVQMNVTGNTTAIDTTHLGGSNNALLRVVASDGVNTGHGDTAAFVMGVKPPQPLILTPADGTHRHYGQLVNFSGEAADAQDGSVAPANLAWSDQKGSLGTGALLSISNLPVGTDVITLTATNSKNVKASTHITVFVDDDLSLPGPTLSAGPTQFFWSFASNASPTQTDVLTLDNVGGGALNWTASTDASWLTLSLTSGTAPSSITLTADPSGLANNTAQSRHLFINVPAGGGSPAQQLSIPVGIGVAVSPENPPVLAPRLYLPLVAR